MVISARYSSSNECCTWWLNSPHAQREAKLKTMTLCCIAYVLLAAVLVLAAVNPLSMAFGLTAAAIAWALVMWNEQPGPPDLEME